MQHLRSNHFIPQNMTLSSRGTAGLRNLRSCQTKTQTERTGRVSNGMSYGQQCYSCRPYYARYSTGMPQRGSRKIPLIMFGFQEQNIVIDLTPQMHNLLPTLSYILYYYLRFYVFVHTMATLKRHLNKEGKRQWRHSKETCRNNGIRHGSC
jgi:hypothetical protein